MNLRLRMNQMIRPGWLSITGVAVLLLAAGSCGGDGHWKISGKKLVVIGIDGMDPNLLQQYMDEGVMPNFKKLAADGTFQKLGTSNPPQSPVAWSNFITGMDPGGHGVFDFLHRNPKTYEPLSSTVIETSAPTTIPLPGDSQIELPGGSEAVRKGIPFWDRIADQEIQTDVYRIPAAYPIQPSRQLTLSDMGTPDLQGGIDGVYFYYTSDVPENVDRIHGGKHRTVKIRNGRFQDLLIGPPSPFRDPDPTTHAPPNAETKFTVEIDPTEPVVHIQIEDGDSCVIKQGEWSPWCKVDFDLGLLQGMSGMCKFFVQEVRPDFRMYVSPMNIDPRDPCMPISSPDDAAVETMCEQIGPFYTQGLAEETKALEEGTITDGEFISQCDEVTGERLKMLDYALERFHDGLLFFYFSSIDLRCHMMWRHIEKGHPARDEKIAALFANSIRDAYIQMDQALGIVRDRIGMATPIVVLSDHGFAPFLRRVNLNKWLLDEGYLVPTDAAKAKYAEELQKDPRAKVQWSLAAGTLDRTKSRAYAVGFNAIYVNLKGREAGGCVDPSQRDALLDEIRGKLALLKDEAHAGMAVVLHADKRDDIYHGSQVDKAPDLVVGYNRGYGASDDTALGVVTISTRSGVLEDNKSAWSGNHLMAPEVVPGVLLTNQPVRAKDPRLEDLTATMLSFFGVDVPKEMSGKSIF